MADQVRWFDRIGNCSGCGKPAHGKLMGSRNESYGAYCIRCAERRLAKAEKEREREERKNKSAAEPGGIPSSDPNRKEAPQGQTP